MPLSRHEQVKELLAQNLTQVEAAKRLGISRQRVSQLAKAKPPKYRHAIRDKILELGAMGIGPTAIANQLGISVGTVFYHRRKHRGEAQ